MCGARQVKSCKSRLLFLLQGRPTSGIGVASRYTQYPLYRDFFALLLGCEPYPGTFNIELDDERITRAWSIILNETGGCLVYAPRSPELSPLLVAEALVYGVEPALVIRPFATRHPPSIVELVACRRLREMAEALGRVYVVVGCGLLRCFEEWSRYILAFTRLSL